jgi:hypothetical protein
MVSLRLTRPRWRSLRTTLPVGFLLAGLLLAASPALPLAEVGPGGGVVREVVTAVDGQQTVALPLTASHVSVHWTGAREARVTVAFAAAEGAFGEDIPATDDDAAETSDSAETYGTVLWAGGARFVRITSDRPIARLSVVAMAQPAGDSVTAGGSIARAAVGQHAVITRAQWGANESLRFDPGGHERWPPMYSPLQQFIVHHTAGRNGDPNPAATIRAIYYDHAVLRAWGDIDYNFLIDEAGRIYEGRRARAYDPGEIPTSEDRAGNVVRGTHAVGFNPGSLGIAMLGNFTSRSPTPAARAALTWLLAWAAERHGLDPTANHLYVNPETGAQKYLPIIAGHRDVNATACPGDTFYPTLPALRSAVAGRIASTTGTAVDLTAPEVATFAPLEPPATGAVSLHVGLIFSEPVSDLTESDFAVTGTATGWTVTGVTGAAAAYTVALSAATPTAGSVVLTLADASVIDAAAHLGPATPAVATVDWAPDGEAPWVVLYPTPGTTPTRTTTLDVTMTFSEPVAPFPSSAIVLGGSSHAATPWSIGLVYGSGASYMFTLRQASPATGTLTIGLPAGATADLATNASLASSITVVVDRMAPATSGVRGTLRSVATMSTSLPARVSWSSTDLGGAGLATYELSRSLDGGAWTVVATGLLSAALNVGLSTGHTYRYQARARDRAGNLGAWAAGATFRPLRYQGTSTRVTYTGTWHTGTYASYSGGTVRYATGAGASASLTISARSIAWVTTRRSTGGVANVYVDGVLEASVDTYAASTSYRQVVFARSWSTLGPHTLKIVVVGTAGRPRVDIDAFEVLQ